MTPNVKNLFKRFGATAKARAKEKILPQQRGLVLSGGGSRAAYQVGVLKALSETFLEKCPFKIIVGSSIGAVNGVLLSASIHKGLKESVTLLEQLWLERTIENTFGGPLTFTLLKSIRTGFIQYLSPGPHPTNLAIFDPSPLRQRIDEMLFKYGGASAEKSRFGVKGVGVMTTVEGTERTGLLLMSAAHKLQPEQLQGLSYDVHYVNSLSSSHALASAALPFVMPPVQIKLESSEARLVDGGIADNIPVDAALRFGAEEIVLIDTSGKKWWLNHFGEPHYKADPWHIPASKGTFCYRPTNSIELRNKSGFGPVLRESIGSKTRNLIRTLGPTWPIFRLLKSRLGEDLAFEVMTYAVIHRPFIKAMIELGYKETKESCKEIGAIPSYN